MCSIPLKKGKNAQLLIQDVMIANDDPWSTVLLKKIKSCYASAPYFDYIYGDLERILSKDWAHLWDLNLAFWELIEAQLGLSNRRSHTQSYSAEVDSMTLDMRGYYKPEVANGAMRSRLIYNQVFSYKHDFVPDLSILDLMMCCGPESLLMLRRAGEK